MARIFISHSSRDPEQAERLTTWLRERGFAQVFLDFDKHGGIPPGADWEKRLYQEIAGAEAVILILTSHWFESKWCFAEFTQARALGKAIFPLIEAPTGETFVSRDLQHLDLVKDREGGLTRLGSELTQIALDARGGFHWDGSRPPFPGLLAFDAADAAIYFGRDDDVRRLIERLNARRAQGGAKMIALLGASGSGKSSLLRAGVLPRLERQAQNWIVLPPFRPQVHPIDELAQAIAIALGTGAGGDWRRWRDALGGADPAHALSDLARDLRMARRANEAQILVSIDQAEELFATSDKTEAERFVKVMSVLLGGQLPFMAMLALPSHYLGQLQTAPLGGPFEEFSLKPMPLERVRDIIEGPAQIGHVAVDEALVTAAMQDAGTEDTLPLLAFTLRELWDKFGKAGRLDLDHYRALGDEAEKLSPLENALRRRADEVLAEEKPDAEAMQALKAAFVPAMVRVNADGNYGRRPAKLDALPEKARPLLHKLVQARLLVLRDQGGVAMIEVVHEALLRKWPLLRGWLDGEREFLIGKDQLAQDLLDWQRAPAAQKDDALLSGLKLSRARSWRQEKSQQLSEAEREYIDASAAFVDAEHRRRERLRRRIRVGSLAATVVLALLTALSLGFLYLAETQRNEALISQSRFLARDSRLAVERGDAVRGMLLALEALPQSLDRAERPFVASAEFALENALANQRERVVLRGHEDWVLGAQFSPDGRRVVTVSRDKTARVYDAANGEETAVFAKHEGPILTATFSPDGATIVTASSDKTARIWRTADAKEVMTLRGHTGRVYVAVFSRDGKRVLTASEDATARIWNAETGAQIAAMRGHRGTIADASFSPDGTRVLTVSEDATARIWDAETGAQLTLLEGHEDEVRAGSWSPDGKRVVTASVDRTARIWNAETGAGIAVLRGHAFSVRIALFSPDGSRILTGSIDRTARLWDGGTGAEVAALKTHGDWIWAGAFSPDGSRVVTASFDNTARIWSAENGTELAVLRGHAAPLSTAVFSPDGDRVVTAARDETARIWNIAIRADSAGIVGHEDSVQSAVFSADGTRVLSASQDKTARIWDAKTAAQVAVFEGHEGVVYTARYSADGKRVVTASADKTARVWDAASGKTLAVLSGHGAEVYAASFSPDGKRVVTASGDKSARIWDAASGKTLVTLLGHEEEVRDAAFSPDGKRIVTVSEDKSARVWDADTGRELRVFLGHDYQVWSVSYSPDGRKILTTSYDKTARVWDAEDGSTLAVMRGHDYSVVGAAFSADGTRVATASWDKTARIWDAETGAEIAVLRGHLNWVTGVGFSPDGTTVVTASEEGTIGLWHVGLRCQALIDAAREALPRGLSRAMREEEFLQDTVATPMRLYLRLRPALAFMLPTAGDRCE